MGGSIRAIDKSSVQKICCGQVVVDLCGAVKELLENALDAGATSIEVKLKEMGLESIEVSDNGSGISSENYETLALKHHTSKLADFSDLANGSILSFGFRGEALNSLCELSREFTVSTKQRGEKVGYSLAFERNGRLANKRVIARTVGTTVTVKGLFEALPVRRGDFSRSIKRQYQKMIKVISSYAVISVGVGITVTNISKTGSRQSAISTQCGSSLQDNISSVFGSKFLKTLLPLDISSASSESRHASKSSSNGTVDKGEIANAGGGPGEEISESEQFCCTGFVSKPREGVGRSDSDRQYVFINGRPVDFPRINRVMNEMWRRFEMAQKPAFIIDIKLAASAVDVNLAPDKREVLIPAEGTIIDSLRSELEEKFAPTRNTFAINSSGFQQPLQTQLSSPWSSSPLSFLTSSGDGRDEVVEKVSQFSEEFNDDQSKPPSPPCKISKDTKLKDVSQSPVEDSGAREETHVVKTPVLSAADNIDSDSDDINNNCKKRRRIVEDDSEDEKSESSENTDKFPLFQGCRLSEEKNEEEFVREGLRIEVSHDAEMDGGSATQASVSIPSRCNSKKIKISGNILVHEQGSNVDAPVDETIASVASTCRSCDKEEEEDTVLEDDSCLEEIAPSIWNFDPDEVLKSTSARQKIPSRASAAAHICSKGDSRVLSKADFSAMRVVGQFNLGFIIAALGSDLYILDQHACDEKYIFEKLAEETVIHRQPLLSPRPLEATPSEEILIQESMSIFEANGFKFDVDESNPPGQRLRLTSVPFSKQIVFNHNDVHELAALIGAIDQLGGRQACCAHTVNAAPTSDKGTEAPTSDTITHQDSPLDSHATPAVVDRSIGDSTIPNLVLKNISDLNECVSSVGRDDKQRAVIRLPKLLGAFASRACRSAVMIGTALKYKDMSTIVTKLGTIDQPWNCPHGRPTMRHLTDLECIEKDNRNINERRLPYRLRHMHNR